MVADQYARRLSLVTDNIFRIRLIRINKIHRQCLEGILFGFCFAFQAENATVFLEHASMIVFSKNNFIFCFCFPPFILHKTKKNLSFRFSISWFCSFATLLIALLFVYPVRIQFKKKKVFLSDFQSVGQCCFAGLRMQCIQNLNPLVSIYTLTLKQRRRGEEYESEIIISSNIGHALVILLCHRILCPFPQHFFEQFKIHANDFPRGSY